MISVGYKNYIALERIIAVISPDSRPIKMLIGNAKENGKLIDATMGKKTKAVVVTDTNQVILSANSTETIIHRIQNYRKN
ncbi:DUF370 domain-containing protein [candidate division KSB1 bacterium]|nr:DUF370 domain-containing protein [candidate division KSB1 bacterium]